MTRETTEARELAELKARVQELTALARDTNAVLAEGIRIQQRMCNAIARVMGKPSGLRPVREAEMAVWMETKK